MSKLGGIGMYFNEERMKSLCKELNIDLVEKEKYSKFFEEESKYDMATLFSKEIEVTNGDSYQEKYVLDNYIPIKKDNNAKYITNQISKSQKLLFDAKEIKNEKSTLTIIGILINIKAA